MIGQKFPDAKVGAVMADGAIEESLSVLDYAKDHYAIVFFYPLDFTFVCPTEILAFDKAVPEFEARNTKVIAASVDSVYSHAAWRRTPLKEGGIGPVDYPILSDINRKLSSELGILTPDGVTYRALYLLDKEGIIRHMVINDLPLGRSVEEALRMVDALSCYEEVGEVCPANWQKGGKAMSATRESTGSYLAETYAE